MRSATLRATVCVMSSDQAVRTRPASPWVTAAAYAVPLCILPSALWRLTVALNGGPERSGNCGGSADRGLQLCLVGLSAGSLVLGLLTVGLVRPWGEVFPRWLPGLGGPGWARPRSTARRRGGRSCAGTRR